MGEGGRGGGRGAGGGREGEGGEEGREGEGREGGRKEGEGSEGVEGVGRKDWGGGRRGEGEGGILGGEGGREGWRGSLEAKETGGVLWVVPGQTLLVRLKLTGLFDVATLLTSDGSGRQRLATPPAKYLCISALDAMGPAPRAVTQSREEQSSTE